MKNRAELTQSLVKTYSQKSGFILSAGPSLEEVNTPEWRAIMQKCLVISIKQAATLFPDETDILLTNDYNLIDFDEFKKSTNWKHIHMGDVSVEADAIYPPDPERKGLTSSVAYQGDLSRNSLMRDTIAPGPGIMYELAFPLLADLKIKHCIIAGWDMTSASNGHNEHFYKKGLTSTWKFHDKIRAATGKKSTFFKATRKLIGKRRAEITSAWIQQKSYDWAARRSTGLKWKNIGKTATNSRTKINSEIDLSRDTSGLWHDYLEESGVSTCIASSRSTADEKFMRIHTPAEARRFLGI